MFSPSRFGRWSLGLLALSMIPAAAHAQVFGGGAPGYGYRSNIIFPGGGVPGLSYNYYNSGWSSPYFYYPNSYSASAVTVLPGFAASEQPRTRPTLYPAIQLPHDNVIKQAVYGSSDDEHKAFILVQAPAEDAKVYLDGVLTQQTGLDRTFVTPKLDLKRHYTLEVRIAWQTPSGATRTVTRNIGIRAGKTERLDLSDLANP